MEKERIIGSRVAHQPSHGVNLLRGSTKAWEYRHDTYDVIMRGHLSRVGRIVSERYNIVLPITELGCNFPLSSTLRCEQVVWGRTAEEPLDVLNVIDATSELTALSEVIYSDLITIFQERSRWPSRGRAYT